MISYTSEAPSYGTYLAASSAAVGTPFCRSETPKKDRTTFGVVTRDAGSSEVMKFVVPSFDTLCRLLT
jgi:hypothetical protein